MGYYGRVSKSKKPNWNKCGFCGAPVLTRRIKGTNGIITLDRNTYQILLDDKGEEFYYDGKLVKGRLVPDGLTAYKRHKCRFRRK